MARASDLPSNDAALHQRIAALEQALQSSQAHGALLQGVLDSMPDVLYATDTEGHIRAVNSAFANWLGRPSDAIVGHQLGELFPADLVAYWDTQAQTVQRTGQPMMVEEDVQQGSASRTYLSQRFPLRAADGTIFAIAGIASDISERKQAEQALRDNQRLLRAIINSAPAVIYVKSLDGQLIVVNQLYCQVVGRPVEELIGLYERDLFPAELVAAWRAREEPLFERGEPVQYANIMPLDGTPRDFLTTEFPLADEDHALYAICGISTDVTELQRAERDRAVLQDAVIAAQQATLLELGTPLIPLSDDMLVMPLIGSMTRERAEQVMTTLLEGVTQHRAHTVILDVTGLSVIDTHVANVLLATATAARLLGADVIVTGIGPEVAQTLISIGADLGDIITPGTLQNGVAYALRKRAKARANSAAVVQAST